MALLFGQLQATLLLRELGYVNVAAPSFLMSLFFMFFNPLFWNIAGRLEYKRRILTRICRGNSQIACYALALCIFALGLYRDYLYCAFSQAVKHQPSTTLLTGWISRALGPILMSVGYLFVITSTLRLGITGTFLGDYFGFLMKGRVTGFPYNVSTHPMYEGSTMIFAGYSLWRQSLAGLLLSVAVASAYAIASHFEGQFTTMIYAQAATSKKLRSK